MQIAKWFWNYRYGKWIKNFPNFSQNSALGIVDIRSISYYNVRYNTLQCSYSLSMFSSCKPHSNFRSQPDHNTSKLQHVQAHSLTLAGQLESPV